MIFFTRHINIHNIAPKKYIISSIYLIDSDSLNVSYIMPKASWTQKILGHNYFKINKLQKNEFFIF